MIVCLVCRDIEFNVFKLNRDILSGKISSIVCISLYLAVSSVLVYFLDQRGDQPVGLIVVEIIFAPVILMIVGGLPLDIGSSARLSGKSE